MTPQDIWQKVESFRSEHQPYLNADKIPLDLLTFAELELKLDIIPYDGLSADFSADAAILSDFSGFYIDGEIYDRVDTASHSQRNRLRFSLAHELGHYVLHQNIFKEAGITNFEALREWLNHHEGKKGQIEYEANEFAGRLLVPIEVLAPLFERLAQGLDALHGAHGWNNRQDLREETCARLSEKFGLHPQGISTRLDREGLWASIY